MKKIETIVPSKKVKDKYYVNFDQGEDITVNTALIADYSLFSGRELEDEEYSALVADAGKMQARTRAMRILGMRDMSYKEMRDRLVQKGETPETAENTAQWLVKIGAIDDEKYASMVVRHYAGKGWGLARIKSELVRRGISRELQEKALEEMPETDDMLDRLVRAKLKGGALDRETLKKASASILRRGYSWEEVRSAIDRYKQEIEES